MPIRISPFAALLLVLSPACLAAAEKDIGFNSQVRPILSENCFKCHGPDENARQAELRLDKEEVVFADPNAASSFAASLVTANSYGES
jgi:hypothetical protein